MRLGKRSVADSSPHVPSRGGGIPLSALSLPSLASPSRRQNSLPSPALARCRGGREVARGLLAPALGLPFSILYSRAFPPGLSHLQPQNPFGCRSPSPRASQQRGTWLLPPKGVGVCPPVPVPPTGAPFPPLRAPSGAPRTWGRARCCRSWPEHLLCSSTSAGTAVPCARPGFGVLYRGALCARCSPACPSPGMLALG